MLFLPDDGNRAVLFEKSVCPGVHTRVMSRVSQICLNARISLMNSGYWYLLAVQCQPCDKTCHVIHPTIDALNGCTLESLVVPALSRV